MDFPHSYHEKDEVDTFVHRTFLHPVAPFTIYVEGQSVRHVHDEGCTDAIPEFMLEAMSLDAGPHGVLANLTMNLHFDGVDRNGQQSEVVIPVTLYSDSLDAKRTPESVTKSVALMLQVPKRLEEMAEYMTAKIEAFRVEALLMLPDDQNPLFQTTEGDDEETLVEAQKRIIDDAVEINIDTLTKHHQEWADHLRSVGRCGFQWPMDDASVAANRRFGGDKTEHHCSDTKAHAFPDRHTCECGVKTARDTYTADEFRDWVKRLTSMGEDDPVGIAPDSAGDELSVAERMQKATIDGPEAMRDLAAEFDGVTVMSDDDVKNINDVVEGLRRSKFPDGPEDEIDPEAYATSGDGEWPAGFEVAVDPEASDMGTPMMMCSVEWDGEDNEKHLHACVVTGDHEDDPDSHRCQCGDLYLRVDSDPPMVEVRGTAALVKLRGMAGAEAVFNSLVARAEAEANATCGFGWESDHPAGQRHTHSCELIPLAVHVVHRCECGVRHVSQDDDNNAAAEWAEWKSEGGDLLDLHSVSVDLPDGSKSVRVRFTWNPEAEKPERMPDAVWETLVKGGLNPGQGYELEVMVVDSDVMKDPILLMIPDDDEETT